MASSSTIYRSIAAIVIALSLVAALSVATPAAQAQPEVAILTCSIGGVTVKSQLDPVECVALDAMGLGRDSLGNSIDPCISGGVYCEQGSVVFLALADNGSVPYEIVLLQNLRGLDVSESQLESVSPAVFALENLEWLNLYNNHLTDIPAGIGTLTSLRFLSIGNQVPAAPAELEAPIVLPDSLWNLENLEMLGLGSLEYASLSPDIAQLTELRALDLAVPADGVLPPEMASLANLCRIVMAQDSVLLLPENLQPVANATECPDPYGRDFFHEFGYSDEGPGSVAWLLQNYLLAPVEPPVAGDVDCSGSLTILDALDIVRYEVGFLEDGGSCPLASPATQISLEHGDATGDGLVNVIDALVISQCLVGIVSACDMMQPPSP